ncbi:MAG: carboxypeptidase regulatory-like domain-containing protein [Roseburia sp.]|nr:carboxypeptidase regulatory-like domain-containing protein [Roseburia sp.]
MKKIKKGFALLLVFVMAVSVIPQSVFAAKKKVKLSKKAVTVAVGESVKIQLKNNKKKVKWSITSGKKNVTLSKKKKTGVIIKGKKAGKAKVQAKIGKKKYVCKVTVKKAATAGNENPNNGKTTAEPTQVPSQAPTVSQQPVPPVITPGVTPSEPTIKPENHYQGLYAESEPFVISSVTFDKEITSYSLAYTNIYVNQEGAASLKEVVPDVSKCTFTVYCYGKKAEVKRISDIVWNEEEGEDPYYSFALTVEQDGKEYTETVKMRLGVPKYPNNPGDLSNGLTLLSLQADDKTYELERNVAYGGETYYFKDKEIDISKIAEAKKVSIVGVYEEEKVKIDVEIRRWNQGYAFFTNQSFKKGNLEIGSGYFYGYKKSDRYFDVDAFTSTKGEVTGDMVSNEWCFVYEPKLEKGKSLKDIFGNLSEELKIYRTVYNNAYYKDNEIRNVVWHEESFYENKEDPGYYTFDIVVTVDGKELTQKYKLVQRQRTYQVSGKLTTADGVPISDVSIMLEQEGGSQETVKTDSEGYFSKELIKGTYQFELGKPFTVEDKDLQWNESLPLYKIAGKVTREGAAQSTDVPGIHFQSEEQKTITSGSDYSGTETRYWAYLEKGTYNVTSYNTLIETIIVTKSETHDITMELGMVFGKGSGYYKFVNTEDPEVYEQPYAANGSYKVYLKPGTYEVQKDGTVIDTIEVTLGDMEKDYVSYTCKGELLDMKGVQIPKNVYNYDIVVKKEDKVYKNLSLTRWSEGTSGYSFSALPGTYQFYYGENKIAEITVTDSDVVQDLTMPVKYKKIKMYDAQKQLIPLTQQVTLINQESSQQYNLYGDEDSVDFSIAVALPLGTYQFETYEGMPSVQGKTITVKEDSDEIVMNMNVYKLTGNCKINGESADRSTWIDLRRKEDGYYLASCTVDDEGNYVFYLEPGEYTMKVYNSNVTMDKGEDVSITNDAVVKDLDITNAN